MDTAAIRTGLLAALRGMSGVGAYGALPDALEPPAVVVGLPESVTYATTVGGCGQVTIPILCIAGRTDDYNAVSVLDLLVSSQGVKRALETDRTLGGIVRGLRVPEARSWSPLEVGAVNYLSCQVVVNILE